MLLYFAYVWFSVIKHHHLLKTNFETFMLQQKNEHQKEIKNQQHAKKFNKLRWCRKKSHENMVLNEKIINDLRNILVFLFVHIFHYIHTSNILHKNAHKMLVEFFSRIFLFSFIASQLLFFCSFANILQKLWATHN